MANRFHNPRPQFSSSTAFYAGGSLNFYESETDTPLAVYSDPELSVSLGSELTLNSAGYYTGEIFLQDRAYKVVLENSSGTVIWTADPVSTSDFSASAQFITFAGNPNGSVAGTAGSGTTHSDAVWDRTNNILYICTTSGDAASAVWTAVNASSATPAVPQPQGRLTLTSGAPVLASGVSAGTSVYYTPYIGELVPIYNGTSTVPTEFSELTLTLVASHAASTIYDVFVFSNNGVLTLATGPAWSNSGAGTGARGSGAGTTQISRLNGLWVNTVSMTGRNGSTTYSIDANRATYLGSIFMDGSNGQLSCHTAYGQSRKWGVWNAYNRVPIYLQAGDSTSSWTLSANTAIRASRNDTANSLTVFCGLAEETFDLAFRQSIQGGGTHITTVGIGFNSTAAFSDLTDVHNGAGSLVDGTIVANSVAASFQFPVLGISTVTSLERVTSYTNGTATFNGTASRMVLSAKWNG